MHISKSNLYSTMLNFMVVPINVLGWVKINAYFINIIIILVSIYSGFARIVDDMFVVVFDIFISKFIIFRMNKMS